MVSLLDVVASNRKIASAFPNGLVAVFVGGTSGVGEYTVKAFAKYTRDSRAYIVGRSADAGDRIVKECYQLNPDGVYKFIQSDISLLRNVDSVCNRIKQQESSVNILFLTQGSMADDLSEFISHLSHNGPLVCCIIDHHVQQHPKVCPLQLLWSCTHACASYITCYHCYTRHNLFAVLLACWQQLAKARSIQAIWLPTASRL